MPTAGERQAAADVLAKAKARTARVALVLDGDLLAEHERLTAELDAAEGDDPKRIADAILDVEDRIAAAEITFVFKAIGRGRWRKLVADHPPSDEDRKTGLDFDPDQFPFVAMAESLVDPAMTAEDLRQLHDEVLTELDFQTIWTACLKANIGGGATRPESQAARAIAGNGRPRSQLQSVSAGLEAS